MNKRRILFRACTILILIAIAACMMFIGRGHTMYFDNKKLEYNGETLDTYRRINVFVDGEQVAKLGSKERGMASFTGQSLTFDLEVTKEKGDDPVNYHYTLKVPYGQDGTVINLPGLIAELPQEAWQTVFVPIAEEPSEEDEEIVTDEFAVSEDF
ncbi:MAG: hypothetical protein E7317_06240 [Clostridiales bacterium]|nr:hypothetical protein [Clostridiales bacterium]